MPTRPWDEAQAPATGDRPPEPAADEARAIGAPAARTTGPDETPSALAHAQQARPLMAHPLVLAITGASGAPYGLRLLEVLARGGVPTWVIVSAHGWRLLRAECGVDSPESLQRATGGDWASITLLDDADRGGLPASGSNPTRGMVICPCSMGTVAAIAHGTSRSLIERAADVTLKERRPLVLVPRETPLSLVHLRNLTAATEVGATVLYAAPGFYHRPTKIQELIDFVVQRVLDHFAVDARLVAPWSGDEA